MTKKVNKKILYITLIFVCLVLVSTFVIEYGLNHQPCNLCVYERIPYFISILLISKILFTKDYEKITLSILSLVFIISSALAFYHFGIEQGFFEESAVCPANNLDQILSKEDLLKQLKQNTVSCKDVTFRFLGLSLASINTIFSLILSCIFFLKFKKYENNK